MPPGGVPEGRVPFISMPAGGVPDGWVPLFTCIPAGGVPDGAADWSDDPAAACAEAAVDCVDDAVPDAADCADELPESDVQPATKIPATRNTDAINMMIMLLFMGYVSFTVRMDIIPDDPDKESYTGSVFSDSFLSNDLRWGDHPP
jgi:hypothetical protein